MNKISSRRVPREPSSFFPLARFVNGSVPCVFLLEAGEKCVEAFEVDRLHDPSVKAKVYIHLRVLLEERRRYGKDGDMEFG